ncbi:MAG: trypsin-like peptidase domain-containing protein [Thermoleophilia bacterium]|nr:trypsin-like peptidase domain-containing protein [Thermoleophilia bacterium]
MKKIVNIAISVVAGLAGAALFFLLAFSMNLGGLGETQTTVTIPEPTEMISSSSTSSGDSGPERIYKTYADSVVQIVSTFPGQSNIFHSSGSEQQGIGSGFVVSTEGYILTNAHVVTSDGTGSNTTRASDIEINFTNGKKAKASIVGYDLTSSDVAVLKIDPQGLDLVPVALGDSSTVVVGEPVAAIGSPFGEYSGSITSGIVSAINRTVASPEAGFSIQNAIQTDTAINQGNSGGPLFNSRGEVIGLNEQIATNSGGSEGVGFAVPINTAKKVMEQIIAKGEVEYAWLGVIGQTVDPETAQQKQLAVDAGAIITEIVSGAPAEQAGLQAGDIVTDIDGQKMDSMEGVSGYLAQRRPGDKIKLTYMRGTESHEVEIELAKRPERV